MSRYAPPPIRTNKTIPIMTYSSHDAREDVTGGVCCVAAGIDGVFCAICCVNSCGGTEVGCSCIGIPAVAAGDCIGCGRGVGSGISAVNGGRDVFASGCAGVSVYGVIAGCAGGVCASGVAFTDGSDVGAVGFVSMY